LGVVAPGEKKVVTIVLEPRLETLQYNMIKGQSLFSLPN